MLNLFQHPDNDFPLVLDPETSSGRHVNVQLEGSLSIRAYIKKARGLLFFRASFNDLGYLKNKINTFSIFIRFNPICFFII